MAKVNQLRETASPDGEVDLVQAEGEPTKAGGTSEPRKKPIMLIVGLVAVAAVVVYGYRAWQYGTTHVATDDAYVTNSVVPVNSRIAGIVDRMVVKDNQHVKQGALLVVFDDASFRADVAQAEANLAMAKAAAGGASSEVDVAEQAGRAHVTQALGALEVGESDISTAEANVKRALSTVATAEAAVATTQAEAHSAQLAIRAREATIRTLSERVKSARAMITTAEASVHVAESGLRSAEATAANARKEAERAKELADEGAISVSQAETKQTLAANANAAVESAREQVNAALSAVEQRKADLSAAIEQVNEANVGVGQAKAQAVAASRAVDAKRAQVREAESAVSASRQGVVAAEARRRQAQGTLVEAQTAPSLNEVREANRASALAKVKQAAAALEAAKIALQRTRIYAPIDGTVSRKTAQIGQQLASGQPMLSLIPEEKPWVVANFKETQLERIHPGESVEIHVDALPGIVYKGVVDSISSGTGATFALLPPDNATGNFTKVVQRVPVKIVLDANQANLEKLRAGLSTNVAITVRG